MEDKSPEEKGEDLLKGWIEWDDDQEEADWQAFLKQQGQGRISVPKAQIAPDVRNGDLVYWDEKMQRYERSRSVYLSSDTLPAQVPPVGKVTFVLVQPDGTRHSMHWDETLRCLVVGNPLPPEDEGGK